MKRVINVYIVTARRTNSKEPVSSTRGAKWTLQSQRSLFGFLKVSHPLPPEEVAQAAVETLRTFGCDKGFIPDPDNDSVEGGKYLSDVEVDSEAGTRKQRHAFLEDFTEEEHRLINAKIFGG